jgi:hypothetical protein
LSEEPTAYTYQNSYPIENGWLCNYQVTMKDGRVLSKQKYFQTIQEMSAFMGTTFKG